MKKLPKFKNEIINAEHKDLLLFLSQIKTDKDHREKIFNTFITYLDTHYIHEEELMIKYVLPTKETIAHIKAHNFLCAFFVNHVLVNNQYYETNLDIFIELLTEHLYTYDVILAELCESHDQSSLNT
jgi:hemerythrin